MTVAAGSEIGLPVEIAFLARHGVPPSSLAEATRIAGRIGVDPSRQVIASGLVAETDFYRALADELGLQFLDGSPPLRAGGEIAAILRQGVARIRADSRAPFTFVLAPTGAALRRLLVTGLRDRPDVAIVTPAALAASLRRANAMQIAGSAAWLDETGLGRTSARAGTNWPQKALAFGLAACLPALAVLEPVATLTATSLALSPLFLGLLMLRLGAVLEKPAPDLWHEHGWQVDDARLPVYTVTVPLLREEKVLDKIVTAMAALDYPPAKLDIRLLIEESDAVLRAAVAERDLPPQIEVVIVPNGQPRTKPRALNVALAEARGALFTIYDAEDVPDPRQLRLAAARFLRSGPELVCLQARLVIDNPGDGPLQGLFALEYAGLFDVLNPGLLRGQLPILLGGTSNHFRTDVLRAAGGWDPFNVTEDADLGMRLYRLGYRSDVLLRQTLEDAPTTARVWMNQRTRWFKGWLQTWLVMMRAPAELRREMGTSAFAMFNLLIGGMLISSLAHPFILLFIFVTIWALMQAPGEGLSIATQILFAMDFTNILGSYAAVLGVGSAAMIRHEKKLIGWRWLALPAYWMMVSAAAWRAVFELRSNPFLWHKTPHEPARCANAADSPAKAGQTATASTVMASKK